MKDIETLYSVLESKILSISPGGMVPEEEKGYVRALVEIKEYIEKKFDINRKEEINYLSSLTKN